MAQKYQKIDGKSSDHTERYKPYFYNKEEHLEVDSFLREADLHHQKLTCTKNPGHEDFSPASELSLDQLPESLRHTQVLDYFNSLSKIVVRVKVSHTSCIRPKNDPFLCFAGRPICRAGTGCVDKPGDVSDLKEVPCRDTNCIQIAAHNAYGYIDIRTDRHLVWDRSEAMHTEVEFFYDTDNRLTTVTARGHDLKSDPDGDTVVVRCITHDETFVRKVHDMALAALSCGSCIPSAVREQSMIDFAIIISHPHGQPKKISIGRLLEFRKHPDKAGAVKRFFRQVAGRQRQRVTAYSTATCPGCTGAPVITGFGEAWKWWVLTHNMADLNTNIGMAFT